MEDMFLTLAKLVPQLLSGWLNEVQNKNMEDMKVTVKKAAESKTAMPDPWAMSALKVEERGLRKTRREAAH